MTSIEIDAPAKVNLYLKVLNKRNDSYHNILTVFEKISLADTIRISKASKAGGITVISDKFITRDPKNNLVYKAAELLLKRAKVKVGVNIAVKKRIPIGAGLGGGSSDAASTLVGINKLLGLKLKKATLMRLGAKLGADVPFFIFNSRFALGMSKGDKLNKISSKTRFWHLLVWPGFEISTRRIYEAFDASNHLTGRPGDVKITLSLRRNLKHFGTAESMLHNDLEEIVKSKRGIIGSIIERLVQVTSRRFIVSGSGPSLFCLYRTKKEVTAARRRILASLPAAERKGWQIFVTRTLN